MAKVRILSGSEPATLIEKNITANGTYNASADEADGYSSVNVNVQPILLNLAVTENGTYIAHEEPGDPDGYARVLVNVPTGAVGVIVGDSAPESSQGSNGDYYYQRAHQGSAAGTGWNYGSSGQRIGGIQFTPTENIYISAIRAYNRFSSNITGKVGLYTDNGVLITESNSVTLVPGWNTIPIERTQCLANSTYVAISTFESTAMIYSDKTSMSFSSKITNVAGRYGGYIGTLDSNNIYSTDIVIEDESAPLYVNSQYIKQNGTWVEIPSGII